MSPPLWLLDVDGVLNALSARPGRATWPDWEWGTAAVHGVDWPIRFAPAVSAYVTAVHADDRTYPPPSGSQGTAQGVTVASMGFEPTLPT